jgi:hypothetical protein
MHPNFTTRSGLAGAIGSLMIAGTFALALAIPQAGYAQAARITSDSGNWKINLSRSTFGPQFNTLVLDRAGHETSTPSTITMNGNPTQNAFVVIANGKVYIAVADYGSLSGSGIKTVDYARWRDMKLVQVGENVHSEDHCGFRCQSGGPENRLTVSFRSVNGGMAQTNNVLVYNEQ